MDSHSYVYNLPWAERTELCRILNRNNKWRELAVIHMGYRACDIQDLRSTKNPTDELLTVWGLHNHTIPELFVLLARMHHYEAMAVLKPFVTSKFHPLLYNGEANVKNLVAKGRISNDTKDLRMGVHNLDLIEKPARRKAIANRGKQVPVMTNEPDDASTKKINGPIELVLRSSDDNSLPIKLKSSFSTLLPQIPYDELTAVTDNWNAEKNLLGKGGFAYVFRGTWKNTDVAIKKIVNRGGDNEGSSLLEQSLHEIKILSSLPHENVLALYAYSVDGEAPCLVYQCMINGSLQSRLHSRRSETAPLSWHQRREIAVGTARGLQYLHTIRDKPLIHGDIKSGNILLDKNLQAKIGDFGLAREGPSFGDIEVSKVRGTRPYLPDEYVRTRKLTTRIDTYSYGVVLFELATGLLPFDISRPTNKLLRNYVHSLRENSWHLLRDERAGKEHTEVFDEFIRIGKWCTMSQAVERPEMTTVYKLFL